MSAISKKIVELNKKISSTLFNNLKRKYGISGYTRTVFREIYVWNYICLNVHYPYTLDIQLFNKIFTEITAYMTIVKITVSKKHLCFVCELPKNEESLITIYKLLKGEYEEVVDKYIK